MRGECRVRNAETPGNGRRYMPLLRSLCVFERGLSYKHGAPTELEGAAPQPAVPIHSQGVRKVQGQALFSHWAGLSFRHVWLLVALGWWSEGPTCRAQVAATNVTAHWLRLAEVREKWDRVPLEAVRRAAASGELTAEHYLGFAYTAGERVTRDGPAAVSWYERAAKGGYVPARYNLGRLYQQGELVPADLPKAFDCYQQAADQGLAEAMYALYRCYWRGEGVAKDGPEGMKWLKKAAEAGSADAEWRLGYWSENPLNYEPKNMPEAVRWYRRAAEQNDARAQYGLGLCYLEGLGVEWDEERGLELVCKAADQGHAESQFKLAELYGRGIGEPRNEADRPLQLLERAAKRGYDKAYERLIIRCEFGVGTARDVVAAAQWYCRAALANLGSYSLEDKIELSAAKPPPLMRSRGSEERSWIGVVIPWGDQGETGQLLEALCNYMKAARLNRPEAPMRIAQAYETGQEVAKNPAKAWLWYTLAAQRGGAGALGKAAAMAAQLTDVELEEARGLLPGLIEELQQVAASIDGAVQTGERRYP